MKNFKNDALTTAEQNNVEGGLFCLSSLVKKAIKLPFQILAYKFGRVTHCGYPYGGGCNSGCNSGCGNVYKAW